MVFAIVYLSLLGNECGRNDKEIGARKIRSREGRKKE
jgi:hypothetical protein